MAQRTRMQWWRVIYRIHWSLPDSSSKWALALEFFFFFFLVWTICAQVKVTEFSHAATLDTRRETKEANRKKNVFRIEKSFARFRRSRICWLWQLPFDTDIRLLSLVSSMELTGCRRLAWEHQPICFFLSNSINSSTSELSQRCQFWWYEKWQD